jgi:hypothetical protein
VFKEILVMLIEMGYIDLDKFYVDGSNCADAGYGSEENYVKLEELGIAAYVKYPLWHQEVTGELAKKEFRRENWAYDETENSYTCPDNRRVKYVQDQKDITANGYERTVSINYCTLFCK